jgi:hypothetical protein
MLIYEANILYRSKMKSKDKKYYAFLFNDLFIITQPNAQNKYRVKKTIPLLEGTTIDQVKSDEGKKIIWSSCG